MAKFSIFTGSERSQQKIVFDLFLYII